jgi:hypothetical protein
MMTHHQAYDAAWHARLVAESDFRVESGRSKPGWSTIASLRGLPESDISMRPMLRRVLAGSNKTVPGETPRYPELSWG